MTPIEILHRFGRRGVYFLSEKDQLRATGNTAFLSDADKAFIKDHKKAIRLFIEKHPRLNTIPDATLYSPFKASPSTHSALVLHCMWQRTNVIHWIFEQTERYKGINRLWDITECEYAAMRDLVEWQMEERNV